MLLISKFQGCRGNGMGIVVILWESSGNPRILFEFLYRNPMRISWELPRGNPMGIPTEILRELDGNGN